MSSALFDASSGVEVATGSPFRTVPSGLSPCPGACAANSAHRSVSCNILIRVRLRFRETAGARGGLKFGRLEMCSVAQVEPHLRSVAGDVEEGCALPRVG